MNVFVRINRKIQRAVIKALINAVTKPRAIRRYSCTENDNPVFIRSYVLARKIVGTPRRNVNSNRSVRSIPKNNPPMIIAPQREIPGNNAND